MLRPKIVSPHLVVVPRFSLDEKGRYAISRSPLVYPLEEGDELQVLRFFLAILNSSVCHWQIAHQSHKYSRGYAMLEQKSLRSVKVPDPAKVEPKTMKRLLGLVNKRMSDPSAKDSEQELDRIVAHLYGLTSDERRDIGMEE